MRGRLSTFLAALAVVASMGPASGSQDRPSVVSSSKLTNKDVLQMQSAGLSGEIITEKIKTSGCDFDTAPGSLSELKSAGVPDSVILAVMRCQSPEGQAGPPVVGQPSSPASGPAPTSDLPKGYTMLHLKSNLKWKLGFRSEPYDKISGYLEEQLTTALGGKGVHRVPVFSGCCQVTLELLQVTTHPAMIKKPGIDVSANVSVTDAQNRLVYSKGYRGQARTAMSTWGRLIHRAVDDMVKNIVADETFMKALATGRP